MHTLVKKSLWTAAAALLAIGCEGPDYQSGGSRGAPAPGSDPVADPAPGDGEDDPADGSGGVGVDTDGDGYVDAVEDFGDLGPEWEERLAARTADYSQALRVASLRLRGELPSLLEIRFVAEAPDPRAAYEAMIDAMLEDPRFTRELRTFWRDTFRMGSDDLLETAPTFATQLVVEDRPLTELFTATSGNCPSYDSEAGAFVPADCDNGVPAHAGVLTNTGTMKHFFSNLAFRRVRWIQETFVCSPMPAEVGEPVDVGGAAAYTAPWAFESIAGARNGGRIDFLDTSSVVCANCHATMNHIAPLFAPFDADGMWSGDGFAVPLPIDGNPTAELADWLPAGETTHWRLGVPAADLPQLGAAMAADPAVAQCTVTRFWNWAFGKGDVVTSLAVVPPAVIEPIVGEYVGSGHDGKRALRAIFTSDDFVRF